MISLANLLCYYFIGDIEWITEINDDDPMFEQVRKIKLKQTPEMICVDQALPLLPFYKEVMTYEF